MKHEFKPSTLSPCIGLQHPDYPNLFYMDVVVDDNWGITGYVPRDVAALVEAAPELLAAARFVIDGDGQPDEVPRALAALRAAVAKAEKTAQVQP